MIFFWNKIVDSYLLLDLFLKISIVFDMLEILSQASSSHYYLRLCESAMVVGPNDKELTK